MSHTILVSYDLKKKNKRINVECWVNNDNPNDFTFLVQTKRLVDFKKRHIVTSEVVYGLDSFWVLKDIFFLVSTEPMLLKVANVAINNLQKDKYKGGKYVNNDLSLK
jgi:hypothetical protein